MRNAIEIERVRNGWIIRENVSFGGDERVTTREEDLRLFLIDWLNNGGRKHKPIQPYNPPSHPEGDEEDDEAVGRENERYLRSMLQKGHKCAWAPDVDGFYRAGCDHTCVFEAGDVGENGFKFCPYCGLEIFVHEGGVE